MRALGDGTIAGAGIDVVENEPKVPEETKQTQVDLTVENLRANFGGRPVPSPVL